MMFARFAIRMSRPLCLRFTSSSTATDTPPLLLKIRADLKTAMRAKDTTRLAVLRSLLSSTLNASKTKSPITTSSQVLSLIRKNIKASQLAAKEFKENGRNDLAEKENSQIEVLEEYKAEGEVGMAGRAEIYEVVAKAFIDLQKKGETGDPRLEVKVIMGVLKKFKDDGRDVDRSLVSEVVDDIAMMGVEDQLRV